MHCKVKWYFLNSSSRDTRPKFKYIQLPLIIDSGGFNSFILELSFSLGGRLGRDLCYSIDSLKRIIIFLGFIHDRWSIEFWFKILPRNQWRKMNSFLNTAAKSYRKKKLIEEANCMTNSNAHFYLTSILNFVVMQPKS